MDPHLSKGPKTADKRTLRGQRANPAKDSNGLSKELDHVFPNEEGAGGHFKTPSSIVLELVCSLQRVL